MKKLLIFLGMVLCIGCGSSDQPGGSGKKAIMKGRTAHEWVALLKSPDEELRRQAEKVLTDGWRADPTVRDDVVETLRSNDNELRVKVCELLGNIGWDAEEAAFETLQKLLSAEPDENMARAIAMAMKKINPRKAGKLGIPSGEKVRN
jgi:HEAT repeat protein